MNLGFFKQENIPVPTSGPSRTLKNCATCGLYKGCRSPKLKTQGQGAKKILIVLESPEEEDDLQGEWLSGQQGKLLENKLRKHGIDAHIDCWVTGTIHCRLPKIRDLKAAEIAACRSRVWDTIKEKEPKLILLFGGGAVDCFVGDRWNKDKLGGIARWRGWTIPDRKARAWACPMLTLTQVLESRSGYVQQLGIELTFNQDLSRALGQLEKPFPYSDIFKEEEFIHIVQDEKELTEWLVKIDKLFKKDPRALLAVDIETTGLKPYREGHRILTCAFCWSSDECVAFPWPVGAHQLQRIRRILKNPGIPKIAANLPYEDRWFTHFGYPVQGWEHDTLLGAHVEDNRSRITGLKFQVYVHFGVVGYDDSAQPWIGCTSEEEKAHGTNGYNRFAEFFRREPQKLLMYDGLDALYEYRLARKQIQNIGEV